MAPSEPRGSLAMRLLVPSLVVLVSWAVASLHYQLRQDLQRFRETQVARARSVGGLLAEQLSVALALGDRVWLERLVSGALRGGELAYCAVLDEHGAVLAKGAGGAGAAGAAGAARAREALAERPLEPAASPEASPTVLRGAGAEPLLETTLPLLFAARPPDDALALIDRPRLPAAPPEQVGWLRVGMALAEGEAELRRGNSWLLGRVLAGLLLTALALGVFVHRAVAPLRQMSRTAARVAASGALDERVAVTTGDEVGTLAESFNTMLERLRRGRSFYDVVGATIPMGLALVDDAGLVLEANARLSTTLGRPPGQGLVGQELGALLGGAQLAPVLAAAAAGSRAPATFNVVLPVDGSRRTLHGLATSIPGGAGSHDSAFLVVLVDRTEAEAQQEQARELELRVERSGRLASLGALVAGVAHEFNNILQITDTYTELALPGVTGEARGHLDRVLRSTERAARIVSRLLSFARRVQPSRTLVDLPALVDETLVLVSYSFARQHVTLRRVDEQPPPVAVDAGQLQQVLLNLLQNAVHAMSPDGGTLTVSVRWLPEAPWPPGGAAGAGVVELVVQDTGRGMSAEDQARLFEPFFSTKGVYGRTVAERRLPGTGLGLSQVYGIVEEHRGEVLVRSAPGQGATFTVRLPAVTSLPGAAGSEAARVAPRRSAAGARALRVLVVDDEPEIVAQLTAWLRMQGLDVRGAADGEAALAALRASGPYDVVVSDWLMPGLSGLELLQTVRREALADRVVLLTGRLEGEDGVEREAVAAGAAACLAKPVHLDRLYQAVAGGADKTGPGAP